MRAILTWHSVDRSGSVISVTPEELEAQFAWLEASATPVRPLAELLEGSDPDPAVALTFDDGFANFATKVIPALERRSWPATVFVVSDHVGGMNAWEDGRGRNAIPRLPLLDWATLRDLPPGLIEVGAHSRSHPRLDRMMDPGRLEAELAGCAEELSDRLGRRPTVFAYPYGASSPLARQVAARHFRWSCGTRLRPLGPRDDPHDLPRVDAWYLRHPGRLGAWGSARCRAFLALRGAVRGARRWGTGAGR